MPTPRVIHFIWAGGEKPFPNDEVLKKWQEKNPDCQIVLWVDRESTPSKVFEDYKQDLGYKECGKDGTPDIVTLMDQQTGPPNNSPKPIVFADINDAAVVTPEVRYEIDRFRRNYGCSSDLLRCHILAKYGGAYFDSDIDPGTKSLSEVIDFDNEAPQFKVTSFTQRERMVGNDAFICSPGHPLMIELFEFLQNNYQETFALNDPDSFDNLGIVFQSLSYRDLQTISRTGPSAVKDFLVKKGMVDPRKDYLPIRSKAYELPRNIYKSHPTNDRNWIGVPIKPSHSAQQALQTGAHGMVFESKYLKISRFDTCVKDIILSLKNDFDKSLKNFARYRFNKLYRNQLNLLPEPHDPETLRQALDNTLKAMLNDSDYQAFKKIIDSEAVADCLEKQDISKLNQIVTGELIAANMAKNIYNGIDPDKLIGRSKMGFDLAKAALVLHERLDLLGIKLLEKEFAEEIQLQDIFHVLDVLAPSNVDQEPTPAENQVALVLMEELKSQPDYMNYFVELNQARQDNKYGCIQTLKKETFPGRFEYLNQIDQCAIHIKGAEKMLGAYQQEAKKWSQEDSSNVLEAQQYFEDLTNKAETIARKYEETLEWWHQQPNPKDKGVQEELECRLHELKGCAGEATLAFLQVKQATNQGDMNTPSEIGALESEIKEHYGKAELLRSLQNINKESSSSYDYESSSSYDFP